MSKSQRTKGFDGFRVIPNYSQYEVSACGIVRRRVNGMTRKAGFVLKGSRGNKGYRHVKIYDSNGVKKRVLVHRLVLTAWDRPPKDGELGRHLDGDPTNNHIRNLAWGTQRENIDDRRKHGRSFDGARNPNAKLNWDIVNSMRSEFSPRFGEFRRLSRKYGVADSQVHEIIKGQSWARA